MRPKGQAWSRPGRRRVAPGQARALASVATLRNVRARMLLVSELRKSYPAPTGGSHVVLDVPRFQLERGQQVAIRGASGSGKTTLLHLIAGILSPDAGRIELDGADLTRLSESRRDRLRAEKVGYIFQTFNLLQGLTVLENVTVGMAFGGGVDRPHAEALLTRVGLADRLAYRPRQLSTGQQQRVAVARALANRPKLVLADEPTGNLDRAQARAALTLIREVCREQGAALLLVSHDEDVLANFDPIVNFADANRAFPGAPAASD